MSISDLVAAQLSQAARAVLSHALRAAAPAGVRQRTDEPLGTLRVLQAHRDNWRSSSRCFSKVEWFFRFTTAFPSKTMPIPDFGHGFAHASKFW